MCYAHSQGEVTELPLLSCARLTWRGQAIHFEEVRRLSEAEMREYELPDEEIGALLLSLTKDSDGSIRAPRRGIFLVYTICTGPNYQCYYCEEPTLDCGCLDAELYEMDDPVVDDLTVSIDLADLPHLSGSTSPAYREGRPLRRGEKVNLGIVERWPFVERLAGLGHQSFNPIPEESDNNEDRGDQWRDLYQY
jgi:hypothetical protein